MNQDMNIDKNRKTTINHSVEGHSSININSNNTKSKKCNMINSKNHAESIQNNLDNSKFNNPNVIKHIKNDYSSKNLSMSIDKSNENYIAQKRNSLSTHQRSEIKKENTESRSIENDRWLLNKDIENKDENNLITDENNLNDSSDDIRLLIKQIHNETIPQHKRELLLERFEKLFKKKCDTKILSYKKEGASIGLQSIEIPNQDVILTLMQQVLLCINELQKKLPDKKIHDIFSKAIVRACLEISVVLIGWYLGGTVGVGTLIFAFGIGPAVALGLFFVNKIS